MQSLLQRPTRRKTIPTRIEFVGTRGFPRRRPWLKPFTVDLYRRVRRTEMAVAP